MKRLLMIIFLMPIMCIAQLSSNLRVKDSTTAFTYPLAAGSIVIDTTSKKVWLIYTKTLTTSTLATLPKKKCISCSSSYNDLIDTNTLSTHAYLDWKYQLKTQLVQVVRNNAIYKQYNGTYAVSIASYDMINGDEMIVYGGTYTDTTTRSTGISVDGCKYYFMPGSIINKTTNYKMFNIGKNFIYGINVYGMGVFNTKNYCYYADTSTLSNKYVFEFDKIVSTDKAAITINYSNSSYYISGNSVTSTAEYSLSVKSTVYANIKSLTSTSTSSSVYITAYGTLSLNSNNIQNSSTGYAVEHIPYCCGVPVITNINNTGSILTSGTYSVYVSEQTGRFKLNSGYITGCNVTSSSNNLWYGTDITGTYIDNVYSSSVDVKGFKINAFYINTFNNYSRRSYVTSGSINVFNNYNGAYLNSYVWTINNYKGICNVSECYQLTQYWGNVDIKKLNSGIVAVRAGTCKIESISEDSASVFPISISLTGPNAITYVPVNYNGSNISMSITNGLLDLTNAKIISSKTTDDILTYNGGNVILNNTTLAHTVTGKFPIVATMSTKNINVLSGGFNTNKNTFSKGYMKNKVTISTMDTTSITLNDSTGGNETFLINNIVTYNTKAKIAQQMVSLINASATLDITASQDDSGTDEYFYIKSDILSRPFTNTIPLNGNVSISIINSNAYSITDIIGGMKIINQNITQ